MANLTITVDAEVLKRARIKALENDESVNAYLARMLEEYAGHSRQQQLAVERLVEIADRVDSGSGPEGRRWTRDELYDL